MNACEGDSVIGWLTDHLADLMLISLDHDLPMNPDHGTGRQVAEDLAGLPPVCPVIVHTSNEFFAPGMMRVLADGGWPVERVYPHDDHNWVRAGWEEQIRALIRKGWIGS